VYFRFDLWGHVGFEVHSYQKKCRSAVDNRPVMNRQYSFDVDVINLFTSVTYKELQSK
jgi:hypothetical protein